MILATLCDGNEECRNGGDENVDQEEASSASYLLLLYTTVGSIALYLTLKILRCFSFKFCRDDLTIGKVRTAKNEFAKGEWVYPLRCPPIHLKNMFRERNLGQTCSV